jgi:hypothetical protein
MKNISKFILTFFIAVPLVFAFGTQTVKQIDEIKNNTGTDIVLNPTDKVDINYFTGEKALQSTVDGELEESAVTNTELGYMSGVTSSVQTQIDSKTPLTRLINTTAPLQGGGDLTTDRTLSILQSGTAQDGYLSQTDWNTFNDKQDAITGTNGDLYYYNSGLSNLTIGTTGQILQVSALGFPQWADLPPSVSVTTKGDIQTYSTAPDRLPVGTNGQVLSANSGTSTGLEWIDPPATSPTTTQGDIIIRGAAQDERLPIGAADQILVSNGTTLTYQDLPVSLPDQTGHTGEYLRTNGTTADWFEINDSTNNIRDNILECASFEDCGAEGTITTSGSDLSGSTTRTVEAAAYNDAKFNLNTLAAATLDYTFTKTASYDGKQMVAYCEIKTANTQVTFSAGADGVEAGSLDVSSDNTWKYYKVPFVGGATSQYFKVDHANAAEIPNIDIDNCFIGKTQDATFKIDTTITDWSDFTPSISFTTNTTSTAEKRQIGDSVEFKVTSVLSGAPNSTTYEFTLPSGYEIDSTKMPLLSSADYSLGTASLFENGVQSRPAFIRLLNSTKVGLVFLSNTGGNFSNVQQNAPFVFGAGDEIHFQFKVPIVGLSSEKSTVVTQDTELTAKTANEFSASFDGSVGSGTIPVLSEDYQGVLSCTAVALGTFDCAINNITLAEIPAIQCTVTDTVVGSRLCSIRNKTVNSFRVQILRSDTATAEYRDYDVTITKQGADVNKSQTIVGKFENINSTDLIQVEGINNTNNSLSGAATKIVFTETKDPQGVWSGDDTFTSPKDTSILWSGHVYISSPQSDVQIRLYKDGSFFKNCGYSEAASRVTLFSCEFDAVKDSVYSIRQNKTINLSANANFHHMYIQEMPDYEAIVKNLSDQAVKCQTKPLTANISTTGVISDFTFNNLTVGKKYQLYTSLRLADTTATVNEKYVAIVIRNGTTILNQVFMRGLNISRMQSSPSTNDLFVADSDTVTVDATLLTNTQIAGASTYSKVRLCELPDTYVETTQF